MAGWSRRDPRGPVSHHLGRAQVLFIALLVAACSTASPAVSPTAAIPSPSFSGSPKPVASQRQEPSLPIPIEEAAAAVSGGKLYVMGGFGTSYASLDSVYVSDGSRWQSGPRLPLPLDHPSAATLNGHAYIAGGHSNGRDSARLFRLDGDHWTELAPMHFARGGHALIADQGKLYAIGGNNYAVDVAEVEAYDPDANSWSVISSLPMPRNHVSGFVIGTQACVAGGRSPTTARVDCLDVVTKAWSRLPDLPQPTSGAGAATFLGGGVVMTGGENAAENVLVNQFTHFANGAWAPSEPMQIPRHGFELAVFNDRAWACGGGTAPGLHAVAVCTSIANPTPSVR